LELSEVINLGDIIKFDNKVEIIFDSSWDANMFFNLLKSISEDPDKYPLD